MIRWINSFVRDSYIGITSVFQTDEVSSISHIPLQGYSPLAQLVVRKICNFEVIRSSRVRGKHII